MPSLLDIIKTAGMDAVGASNPVNIIFGEVMTTAPLSVNIDQRFTLPAEFLILPESLSKYEVDLKHSHSASDGQTGEALTEKLVIRAGLKTGDKVLLIRVQGGQQYVVLDKVVTSL